MQRYSNLADRIKFLQQSRYTQLLELPCNNKRVLKLLLDLVLAANAQARHSQRTALRQCDRGGFITSQCQGPGQSTGQS